MKSWILLISVTIVLTYMIFWNNPWCRIAFNHLPLATEENYQNYSKSNKNLEKKTSYRIRRKWLQWQKNWVLEAIDSDRIFMHDTSGNSKLDLKKSCAVESAAIQNPDRHVQIFVRLPFNQSEINKQFSTNKSSPWIAVLKKYLNVEVIIYREAEYFKNTPLARWYGNGYWKESPYTDAHLSEYAKIVSIFRGGGLFINIEAIITLKPFSSLKWRNFLVKNSFQRKSRTPTNMFTGEIFHLIYGHHLSDEIAINLSGVKYDPLANVEELSAAAIETSMYNVCGDLNNNVNQCLDVHLLDQQDIFLPSFNSSFWHPVTFALKGFRKKLQYDYILDKLQPILNEAIHSHEGSLIEWNKLESLLELKQDSLSLLFEILLAQYCPLTVAYFKQNKM